MALQHAKHGQAVHLPSLAEAAGSRALVKTDDFEAIHLLVPAGSVLPPHKVSGQVTLLCLSGRVSLSFGGTDVTLAAGDWLYLERAEEHGVEGLEDAAILLTILF